MPDSKPLYWLNDTQRTLAKELITYARVRCQFHGLTMLEVVGVLESIVHSTHHEMQAVIAKASQAGQAGQVQVPNAGQAAAINRDNGRGQ